MSKKIVVLLFIQFPRVQYKQFHYKHLNLFHQNNSLPDIKLNLLFLIVIAMQLLTPTINLVKLIKENNQGMIVRLISFVSVLLFSPHQILTPLYDPFILFL